jgi:hypothetical protein
VKYIATKRGKVKISDSDYELVSQYKWRLDKDGYAIAHDGNGGYISMHRMITNCPKGMVIDHINHDSQDNTRENLRICTHSQNLGNAKIRKSKSGYKGVTIKKNRFYVYCAKKYIGSFKNIQDAAIAYNNAAINHFGEFALLNEV